MKYTVCIPYTGWRCYEVEAESKEEAENKAFEENDIPDQLSLCWHCANELDSEFVIDDSRIYVEEEALAKMGGK